MAPGSPDLLRRGCSLDADVHRSRASEDDADYMADLRNFMVPSFDTPGHSSACSVPDTDEKPMQLGKTALSDACGELDVAPAAEPNYENAETVRSNAASSSPIKQHQSQIVQKQTLELDLSSLKPDASAEPGNVFCGNHPNPCADGPLVTDHVSYAPSQCVTDGPKIYDGLPSIPGSISKCGVQSGQESQSTGITTHVDQLVNMSPTDSISSPLLTPGTKGENLSEGNPKFKSADVEDKTVGPALVGAVDRSKSPLFTSSQPGVAYPLGHTTPIASLQTRTTSTARPSHPNSRIPSSIRKPLVHQEDSDNLPGLNNTFSFTTHTLEESVTPKGIGLHQIWDMGHITAAIPKLLLSAAADPKFEAESHESPKDKCMQPNLDTESDAGTGGMLAGTAIHALTPVPHATTMARPAQVSATGSLQGHDMTCTEGNVTAVARQHTKLALKPPNASRIPSRRVSSKSAQSASSAACTTATVQSGLPPGKCVEDANLMPGSIKLGCPPDPSEHTDVRAHISAPIEATSIGTPPFNKLIRYLNGASKAAAPTPAADRLQISQVQEAVSPVVPSSNDMSSVSMCMGMTPDGRLFHQLMKGIQADQYCSPAVDCAAFRCMPQVAVRDESEVNPQPQDSSVSIPQHQDSDPSSIHSVVGENCADESALEAVSCEQVMCLFAAGNAASPDDGCCSRVSADRSQAGTAEHTVDLFSREAMKAFICNRSCASVHRSETTTSDNGCGLVEVPAAVEVTLVEHGGSEPVNVCIAVSESTEAVVPESMAALSPPVLRAELSQDAVLGGNSPLHQELCDLRGSTAISCTVNIGEITPTRDDVADVSSVTMMDPSESPSTDVCNIREPMEGSATGSPALAVEHVDEVFSPPHLSIGLEDDIDGAAAASTPQSMTVSTLNCGLQSPVKSLSPDHAALVASMSGKASPTADHIEIVKEMIRSQRLLVPDEGLDDAVLSELGTPQCKQMVKNINGSFKTPVSMQTNTPGSSMFPDFLEANGIGSALTPGGVPYSVFGGLWKQNRQTEKEFQGWKAVELENAAETEQQHAYDIRKLQEENAAVVKKAVEAEHRAHLLAEELDAARQELADVKRKLQCFMSSQPDTPSVDHTIEDLPSTSLTPRSDDISRLHGVVENIKRLEGLIERVCKRSCTQNNICTVFTQVYSYFHQLQVRLQSGRLRLTRSTRDTVDNVDAFVNWAKPSLEELCEHYDTAASEVTRRSVDIARMRKTGQVAGDAVKQQEDENSHFHQHLEGVSVSMRFHLCEVFNRLHAVGEELMTAMKNGQGAQVEIAQLDDGVNTEAKSIAGRHEASTRDFAEPLSLMLGRRARNITNRLENLPSTLYSRTYSVQPCDSHMRLRSRDLQTSTSDAFHERQGHSTPRLNSSQGFPDICLTSPPNQLLISPVLEVGASDQSSKQGGPVLNMDNPLFNELPETGGAASSDAPPSFAPDDSRSNSVEISSNPSDLLDGLVVGGDDVQTTPSRVSRHLLSLDENSPHLAPAPHKSKKALQYPSKDRIEFICHALNMGISPFARRAHEA